MMYPYAFCSPILLTSGFFSSSTKPALNHKLNVPVVTRKQNTSRIAIITNVSANPPTSTETKVIHPGVRIGQTKGKDEGVFATRSFSPGEIVMVGRILKEVEKNDSHASQVSATQWVRHAGWISKVNHSCGPNCGIHVNETGAHDFVAITTINAGDEITFDYAMRNFVIEHFPKVCMCGAAECRGSVTGYKDLPERNKQRYQGFIAPYLLEIDSEA